MLVGYSVHEMAIMESDNLENTWASVKKTVTLQVLPVMSCLE